MGGTKTISYLSKRNTVTMLSRDSVYLGELKAALLQGQRLTTAIWRS